MRIPRGSQAAPLPNGCRRAVSRPTRCPRQGAQTCFPVVVRLIAARGAHLSWADDKPVTARRASRFRASDPSQSRSRPPSNPAPAPSPAGQPALRVLLRASAEPKGKSGRWARVPSWLPVVRASSSRVHHRGILGLGDLAAAEAKAAPIKPGLRRRRTSRSRRRLSQTPDGRLSTVQSATSARRTPTRLR